MRSLFLSPSLPLPLSLFASLFLLSATAALFYFYSYAFISFLFADAYTMCLRFLCPTHPSAQTEKETPAGTEAGTWTGASGGR